MGLFANGFETAISAILGPVDDLNGAIVKLGLFALLFMAFAKGTRRIFPQNLKAVNLIAGILALLAIRLMPAIWLAPMGKFLWLIIVIILPYLIIDGMVKEWSLIKILFLIATYFGIYLLITSTGYWGFGLPIQFVRDLREYWHYYHWQMLVLGSFITIYSIFHFRKRRDSRKL